MSSPHPARPTRHTLEARDLTAGYDRQPVLRGLDVTVPAGRLTAVVGANACGKSTLVRSLARLLAPRGGEVLLDGTDLRHRRPVEVARTLAVLPQSPVAPDGITVADLVARGRYPRQGFWRRWSAEDDDAVADALLRTGTLELAGRLVQTLSGGQRQRVWIAMTLAQQTDILLLDEPTSALDLAHQIEVLELLAELRSGAARTVVVVLHDLNSAARYADHLIAMSLGRIVAEGPPAEVLTEEVVAEVFGLAVRIVPDPVTGTPMVVPLRPVAGSPVLAVSAS